MWRNRHAEKIKHCRSDVGDVRLICVDGAIAEKHPRGFRRIHVVIAAPGAGVVGNDLFAEATGDCFPSHAVPWRETNHEVGRIFDVRAFVSEVAIDYMVANTGLREAEITAEVDRYIVWPGQATGYKIGELKIKELRAKAKAELGDRFDLRRFHNAVIDDGAVPLQVLQAHVEAWIAAERSRRSAASGP